MEPSSNAQEQELASPDEPLVLIVLPRILDLVIRQERALGISFFALQRGSYALASDHLLEIVDRDELGLSPEDTLPRAVILVAEPRQRRSSSMSERERLTKVWALAFSARVEWAFQELIHADRLKPRDFGERIDQLGHDAFREIEAVLMREGMLFESDGVADIFIHFAALYSELRYFSPHALESYFPALAGHWAVVEDLLLRDIDVPALFEATRPQGAPDPVSLEARPKSLGVEETLEESALSVRERPNRSAYAKCLRRAERARKKGNAVAAALHHRIAARVAGNEGEARSMLQSSWGVIGALVGRLQVALRFDDTRAQLWRESLVQVFEGSSRGFWNANKRLLFDLQKVCLTHERDIHSVDLFRWIRSMGKCPVRRSLPNRREVLMAKYLRTADSRLPSAKIGPEIRERLSGLIRSAASLAETQLRQKLRRRVAHSLNEPGLRPANLPEQVARRKLIEELLDGIVHRGFLTMGDVRDAISRSQLKISDLTFAELMRGDAVLRADRRLDRLLDGVYRGGEFYLRWLQRLSSLGFGSWTGRFFAKFIAVPFGGAFVILYALNHIWEVIHRAITKVAHEPPLSGGLALVLHSEEFPLKLITDPTFKYSALNQGWQVQAPLMALAVLFVGAFLLGLLYWEQFRKSVAGLLQSLFRGLRSLFSELPKWLLGLGIVRWFTRTRLARWLRRYALTPLIPTAVLCLLAWPFVGLDRYWALGFFMLSNVVFNSRRGRDVEELLGMWMARAWYRFRFQFLRGLFEAIVSGFRRAVEMVERVLYAIDEWLLFRGGESGFALWIKALIGAGWSVIAYVIRFALSLLVEPQVNPIKHFPVVTVAHKILLPSQIPLAKFLTESIGNAPLAQTVAATVVLLLPGVFGFLVWELKSNWLLYEANRDEKLKPSSVGGHGESMLGLLKPGFHSGTIAKLFGRMRRAEITLPEDRRGQALARFQDRLHHQEVAIQHFFERELIALLELSHVWPKDALSVRSVHTGPNSIRINLSLADAATDLEMRITEQQGWMVAKIAQPGWLSEVSQAQRRAFAAALTGFYRLSAIDLNEEQMGACLVLPPAFYHLREADVDVWPEGHRERSATYHLRSWGSIRPQPSSYAKSIGLPPISAKRFILSERLIYWNDWVRYWNSGNVLAPETPPMDGELTLFPEKALS